MGLIVAECFRRLAIWGCREIKIWLLQWNDKYPCQWLPRIMTDCSGGVCPSLSFPSLGFLFFFPLFFFFLYIWLHVCQAASKPQAQYEKINGFKRHKLSCDKTKQIKKTTLHRRLKYAHKYRISACLKTSPLLFVLNTVKTPSHFCVLVGTAFALGNQIWLHTFGLTQRGWPVGFTGPPFSPYLPWTTFVICGLRGGTAASSRR